jgi:hypothetical protein
VKRAGLALLVVSSLALGEQPLPVYPGTVHTRIGNDLVISGEFYRMGYFLTPDAPKTVARYFEAEWKRDGYPVTLDGDFEQQGIISAFYTREGLVRSVVLRRYEGRTLGFTVLKDLWVREPLARATKLPTLEGALLSQDVVLRDESGGTQARSSLYATTVPAMRDQFFKAFADKGYKMIRETNVKVEGKPQRVIEFSRGREQAVVSLAEVEPGVIAAQQTWVGSDRPDAVPNDEALKAAREGKR